MDSLTRRFWQDEIVLAVLLLVVFAGVVGLATGFSPEAQVFPSIIGTAGIVLSAGVVIAALRDRKAGTAPPESATGEATTSGRLWLALLSAPAFGLVFWIFGFYVASFLTALAMPFLMGYRNRRVVPVFAVVTVAATALLFPYVLDVSLPHGVVGDWLIDRMTAEPELFR